MEKTIPNACIGVKCMQSGCKNQAMHKVGEENIFFNEAFGDCRDERADYKSFNERHNLTTYLCEDHFKQLMKRETFYGDISTYKHPLQSLDGCPHVYCSYNPVCENKCAHNK